jgi:hypothetical protein
MSDNLILAISVVTLTISLLIFIYFMVKIGVEK